MTTDILDEMSTLRNLIVILYDSIIADLTSQPGYSLEAVDAVTRLRWQVAAADWNERRDRGIS